MMKILVLGIGGVGGFVGGALARNGADVYFFARGRNLEALKEKGLHLSSVLLGDFTVFPKDSGNDPHAWGKMDVIVLCCKGNGLSEALKDITPMIHEETLIVPLLNGVLDSEIIRPHLPPCHVADGTIRVFSHLEEAGHVAQTEGLGSIRMGMYGKENPKILEDFAALLRKCGIKAESTEDIALDSWKKYGIMGSNSAIFCYYGKPAGGVKKEEDHLSIVRGAVREVMAVADKKGVHIPEQFEDHFVSYFESLPANIVTSLFRDLSSGKKADDTEALMILGRMVEMGKETGVAVPIFTKAYENALKGF